MSEVGLKCVPETGDCMTHLKETVTSQWKSVVGSLMLPDLPGFHKMLENPDFC